jgi:uncharacterized protein YcbX
MARRQIGAVAALWRYPVKSLRGESLREAMLTERGLAGDRRWALRELDRGGIMSARTWPSMLDLRAVYETDPIADTEAAVRIELPDGGAIRAGDPAADRVLSDLLRRPVRMERTRAERMTPEEFEAIARGDAFPPRRDFFDEDVIHLIASGTLDHMRALKPGSDFDPRRFRMNIYVDTGSEADCFVEDRWLGGALEIGGARIAGMRPAIRCAITTHPQWDLPHDVAILRTAWQYHQAYAGVFAAVTAPGPIRVGDMVMLVD